MNINTNTPPSFKISSSLDSLFEEDNEQITQIDAKAIEDQQARVLEFKETIQKTNSVSKQIAKPPVEKAKPPVEKAKPLETIEASEIIKENPLKIKTLVEKKTEEQKIPLRKDLISLDDKVKYLVYDLYIGKHIEQPFEDFKIKAAAKYKEVLTPVDSDQNIYKMNKGCFRNTRIPFSLNTVIEAGYALLLAENKLVSNICEATVHVLLKSFDYHEEEDNGIKINVDSTSTLKPAILWLSNYWKELSKLRGKKLHPKDADYMNKVFDLISKAKIREFKKTENVDFYQIKDPEKDPVNTINILSNNDKTFCLLIPKKLYSFVFDRLAKYEIPEEVPLRPILKRKFDSISSDTLIDKSVTKKAKFINELTLSETVIRFSETAIKEGKEREINSNQLLPTLSNIDKIIQKIINKYFDEIYKNQNIDFLSLVFESKELEAFNIDKFYHIPVPNKNEKPDSINDKIYTTQIGIGLWYAATEKKFEKEIKILRDSTIQHLSVKKSNEEVFKDNLKDSFKQLSNYGKEKMDFLESLLKEPPKKKSNLSNLKDELEERSSTDTNGSQEDVEISENNGDFNLEPDSMKRKKQNMLYQMVVQTFRKIPQSIEKCLEVPSTKAWNAHFANPLKNIIDQDHWIVGNKFTYLPNFPTIRVRILDENGKYSILLKK